MAEETLFNYTRDVLGDPEKLKDYTKTEIKRLKNLGSRSKRMRSPSLGSSWIPLNIA
jgi:hypothetical protein